MAAILIALIVALGMAAPALAYAAGNDLTPGQVVLTTQANTPTITYDAHVQNVGWQAAASNGATAGTEGRSLRVEGLHIKLSGVTGGVSYSAHVQNVGWQKAVENGALAGTTGRSLRVEALKINLTGDVAKTYDVMYRVHVQNIGWTSWSKNGDIAGTTGQGLRVEAVQIKLVDKATVDPTLKARAHVQNVGWQDYVAEGMTCGTTGRGLRVEALQIALDPGRYTGGISYQVHVQNIGWQNAVGSNAVSGTSGKSLRVEAVRISLTGDIANHYDIYYRAHVADYGWLDWAKNGASAGSEGQSRRVEAVQIVLRKKGEGAPGATKHPMAPASIWQSLEWKYEDNAKVNDLIFVKYAGGSNATVVVESKENGKWVQKLSCAAYVGRAGIGDAYEGSTLTPSGDFGITGAFGIRPNPASKMSYLQVTNAHYWCGDPSYYNQLIDINQKPHYCWGEHLIDYPGAYDYGMFMDYNTNPVVYGKGSAFFLHCFPRAPYTAGCIAVSRDNMIRIIQTVRPNARICIY